MATAKYIDHTLLKADARKEDIEKLDRKLDRMNQLLYVIAGVITVTCGVSLW